MSDLSHMSRRELLAMGRKMNVSRAARLNKSRLVVELCAQGAESEPGGKWENDPVKQEIFGRWELAPSFYDYTDRVQFHGPNSFDEILNMKRF